MKNNKTLTVALAALFSSGMAMADMTVSGKVTIEHGTLMTDGTLIGADTATSGFTGYKNAFEVRLFADGDITDNTTFHVEALGFNDDQSGITGYTGVRSDTQRDGFRELYIDSAAIGGWDLRLGKQQVVWGTADGMKLLDAINPTDYSEMAQNQMEDSRIPMWMLNAEKDGNQIIISETKSSHMAGMGDSSAAAETTHYAISDAGHAFIMKGVDTISGKKNGFINVVPALGAVSKTFYDLNNSSAMVAASVDDFMTNAGGQSGAFSIICAGSAVTTVSCMDAVTNDVNNEADGDYAAYAPYSTNNQNAQNLIDITTAAEWTAEKASPTQTFSYMPETTFATFDQFVDARSLYRVETNSVKTVALRHSDVTTGGLNYSINFMKGNDTNPYIDTYWTNSADGTVLAETAYTSGSYVTNNLGDGLQVGGTKAGTDYAVFNMVEKQAEITQIGGSFDTSYNSAALGPVVIRGEALYQKDVMSPIVTRKDSTSVDLEHGFLVSALQMVPGDRLKFVLGADITVLTNMMVSAQFIQDSNLDYINVGSSSDTNWKYTADMATMHLTNNLNKAIQHKNFYSLFFSKPFGESGQNRWNNIFMAEEGVGENGYWNRFDADFGISDDVVATVEFNNYGGNANTQFGQLDKSDNMQVGVKYTF